MNRSKVYACLNAALVVAVVGWNYWTAAVGLNGNSVGGMSAIYDTRFTPASWAFSIWGLIFLIASWSRMRGWPSGPLPQLPFANGTVRQAWPGAQSTLGRY